MATAPPVRLPPLPQAAPGDPPYFYGVFSKYRSAQGSDAAKDEAAQMAERIAWSAATLQGQARYKNHYFRWSERNASLLADLRIAQMAKASTWEPSAQLAAELVAAAAADAELCVQQVHRFFKGRSAPLRVGLVPLEDSPSSFVVADQGLFIHVWTSHVQAKTFVMGQRHLHQVLRDLRAETLAVPLTVLLAIYGTYVTVTAVPPLVTAEAVAVDAPIAAHLLDEIEVLGRARGSIRAWQGSDGRLHLLDAMPVTHLHTTSSSSVAVVHPALLRNYPTVAVNVESALDDAMERGVDQAVTALLAALLERAGGNPSVLRASVRVLDIVESSLVPLTLHRFGVKLRLLYRVLVHPKLREGEAGQVAREAVLNEMVARTVRTLVRADLLHTPSAPYEGGTVALAQAFVMDVINRAVYLLLVRKEYWDPHLMPVLRAKYACPEEFTVKQELVAKRVVVSFLRMQLGAVFEGGKFVRIAPCLRTSTVPPPPWEVTRFIAGSAQEIFDGIATRWKDLVSTVQEPSLKICMMIGELVLAAAVRAPNLVRFAGQLTSAVDDVNDVAVSMVVKPVVLECLLQLPEASAFDIALAKFNDGCLAAQAVEQNLDTFSVADRFRLCSVLVRAADKRRVVEAGRLQRRACELFLALRDMAVDLVPDPVFALYCDALKVIYGRTPDSPFTEMRLFRSVVPRIVAAIAQDPEPRLERSMAALRIVLSRMLDSTLNHVDQSTRDIVSGAADVALDLHSAALAPDDPRVHIMLLIAAVHALNQRRDIVGAEEVTEFREATQKIDAALPSEQRSMLRAEWAMRLYAPATLLLMRISHWGLARGIVDMLHMLAGAGQFKASAGRALGVGARAVDDVEARYGNQAARAFPEAARATDALVRALKAAKRLQEWLREVRRARAEKHAALLAEADRMAKEAEARAARIAAPLPLRDVAAAVSTLCDLNQKRIGSSQMPSMHPVYSPLHRGGFALQALIAVAPPKRCANLAAVMLQSGLLPPVKWGVSPAGPGTRAIAIVPEARSLVAWWNERWLAQVEWSPGEARGPGAVRTTTLLYAKIYAVYIYSQNKYSFLRWCIAGYGFAGAIAELLATMVPRDAVQYLVTVGGPAVFGPGVEDVPLVPHAHLCHRRDLHTFLPMHELLADHPDVFERLMSKLQGDGAILPRLEKSEAHFFLPRLTFLDRLRRHRHLGDNVHLLWTSEDHAGLRASASADEGPSVISDEASSELRLAEQNQLVLYYIVRIDRWAIEKLFDIRLVCPQVPLPVYHGMVVNSLATVRLAEAAKDHGEAADQMVLSTADKLGFVRVDKVPVIPHLEEVCGLINAHGDPQEALRVALDGLAPLPPTVEEIVGTMELLLLTYPRLALAIIHRRTSVPEDYGGLPDLDFASRLEKVGVDEIVQLLQTIEGASWDATWVARQLQELSGAVLYPDASSSPPTLYAPLLEDFVETHNFVISVPLTSKSSEEASNHAPETLNQQEQATSRSSHGEPEPEAQATATSESTHEPAKEPADLDRFHVGWTVGIACTDLALGRTVVDALVRCEFFGNTLHILPPPTKTAEEEKFAAKVPIKRWLWDHSSHADREKRNSEKTSEHFSLHNSETTVIQIQFEAVQWNSRRPFRVFLKSVAQLVWVVTDSYTFEALEKSGELQRSEKTLHLLAYFASTEPDVRLVEAIKNLCLPNAIPYVVLSSKAPAAPLLHTLLSWMLKALRPPFISASKIPQGVELGALAIRSVPLQ